MQRDFKFWLKIVLLMMLFIVLFGYSYYKTKDLILGVRLIVEGIENGETVSRSEVELSGEASRAIFLSINGREIFIDQDGKFKDSLILLPGYNIITVQARDKFGKEKKKVFEVFLDQNHE